jgi:hypothetical protein
MFRLPILTVLLIFSVAEFATAQAVIKILEFDKNTGIIDHGEQDGIRVGDLFEVNRYADDFVNWVGRVEVVVVKPKIAGVKVIERAANATFLKGDMLEIRKREYDPLLDKLNHSANGDSSQENGSAKIEEAAKTIEPSATRRERPIQFGLASGLSFLMNDAAESVGQSFSLQLVNGENEVVGVIDMTHSYVTSLVMQGYCVLPLSSKLTVNLNLAYIPLNVNGDVEMALLTSGLKASASLLKISSSLNYRLNDRWQFGGGLGVFMPKLTVSGAGNSLTVSDRHFGFTADVSHFLPLGSRVWLRSFLEYSIFLDDGPAIHSLAFQTGPIFSFGKQ